MAKKGNRVQVILECTEQKESGVAGMSRYVTTKNKKNTPDRLERKKYTKCIKMVKSEKPGAYVFQTQNILEEDEIKAFFAQK